MNRWSDRKLLLLGALLVFCVIGTSGCDDEDPAYDYYVQLLPYYPDDADEAVRMVYLRWADSSNHEDLWLDVTLLEMEQAVGYAKFDFLFNPEVITFDGAALGDVLGEPGDVQLGLDDSGAAEGVISVIVAQLPELEPVAENGPLVSLLFHPIDEGESLLEFQNNELLTGRGGEYISGVSWYGGLLTTEKN